MEYSLFLGNILYLLSPRIALILLSFDPSGSGGGINGTVIDDDWKVRMREVPNFGIYNCSQNLNALRKNSLLKKSVFGGMIQNHCHSRDMHTLL